MNLQSIDLVSVFRELRDSLKTKGHDVHVGMFFYFWGRLSTVVTSAGLVAAEDNEKYIEAARSSLQRQDEEAARNLAEFAHVAALGTPDHEYKLVVVGYWSAISYYFRYQGSADGALVNMALDSFLTALDEHADRRGRMILGEEIPNLSRAYQAAIDLEGAAGKSAEAAVMITWASSCPLGSELPPFSSIHLR